MEVQCKHKTVTQYGHTFPSKLAGGLLHHTNRESYKNTGFVAQLAMFQKAHIPGQVHLTLILVGKINS